MICVKRIVLVCASTLALAGCGYRSSALMPPDVHSVHIKMFDNTTFRHEIEFALTEAVKNEIARMTDLKILPAGAADSVLSGAITRVTATVTAYSERDRIFTQDITVHVRFQWRRRDRNELIAGSSDVAATGKLIAPRGEGQGTATAEAFRDLAQAIVQRMQQGF